MAATDPFSGVLDIQEEIRRLIKQLAQTVTTIVALPDVPQDVKDGHVEREVQKAREKLKSMRLQERMLLDEAVATVHQQSVSEDPPVWAGYRSTGRATAARQAERVQEASMVALVKLNVVHLLDDAPASVLMHRLRGAIEARDFASEEAIRAVVLRRVMAEGTPNAEATPPYSPSDYLVVLELGVAYTGYPEELKPVLQMLSDADDSRLPAEARSARDLVRRGAHSRKPFDLKLWSADDQLLKVVVERLGAV